MTITVHVELRRRSFPSILVRTPRLWLSHYRTIRRTEPSRIVSAYAAWLMASRVVVLK